MGEPCNLHITFRFLGDVEEEKITQISRMLKQKLQDAKVFKVVYVGLGIFEKKGKPAVLWVGVESEGIEELKKRIDSALMPFGFPPEDQFKPHVTLLRIKRLKRRTRFKSYLFKMREHVFVERVEKSVALVESRLTPQGPVYTPLEEFILD